MPSPQHPRLAELGGYWLQNIDGTPAIYLHWYDASCRRTRRRSTGTADVRDAELVLAEHVALNGRPAGDGPRNPPLAEVLTHYWLRHGRTVASAAEVRRHLALWADYWGDATVADLTPQRIEKFVDHVKARAAAPSTQQHVLSTGRAALRLALRSGMVAAVPYLPTVQTVAALRAAPPLGRPMRLAEVARFLDAIPPGREPLFRFCVLLLNTMARPCTVLDLTGSMFDLPGGGVVNLNPPGRAQTRKRRPIIPVPATLEPWLERWGDGNLVAWPGRPESVKSAWQIVRRVVWPPATPAARRSDCAPEGRDVRPYSFRHTLGRELRRRGVPGDQIAIMLGHRLTDESDITGLYSPHDPSYCRDAKRAIEEVCREVDALMTTRRLVLEPRLAAVPGDRREAV